MRQLISAFITGLVFGIGLLIAGSGRSLDGVSRLAVTDAIASHRPAGSKRSKSNSQSGR